MKYAVHFSYVGTAGATSAASFARRSGLESREQRSSAAKRPPAVSRTICDSKATLLPAPVGLSLGSLTKEYCDQADPDQVSALVVWLGALPTKCSPSSTVMTKSVFVSLMPVWRGGRRIFERPHRRL